MQPPRAVAVVLDQDRVLVIKRHFNGRDYAVLPGGGVERGETAAQAAVRELAEETTLAARVERLLWTGEHNGRPASYFLMAGVTGTPTLSGQEGLEHCPDNSFEPMWVRATEFDALNLQPEPIRGSLAGLLAGR